MQKIKLVFWAVLIIPTISHALSYSTPERGFLRQVSGLFEQYKREHGEYPKEWKDVNQVLGDWSLDETLGHIEPSRSYRFVSEEKLTLPFYDDDNRYFRTLLITKGPIRDSTLHTGIFGIYSGITEKKYFALVVGPNEDLLSTHLSPKTVAERYQAAGLSMPIPAEIPERKWVTDAKMRMVFRYAIFSSPVLILLLLAYRRIRKPNHCKNSSLTALDPPS